MSRIRTAALGAVLWCAVVVAVSSLVWVVITRAGQGVIPVSQPQADVTGSLAVPGHDHRPGRPSPGVTLSPRPSVSTATTPVGTPSTGPTTSTPTTGQTTAPPPSAPTPQRRSWSGATGHVVAECRGPSARLVSAYPNAGWRYLILARGPGVVRVKFSRVGEDGRSTTVDARCVTGVPHFTEQSHAPGDD